MLDGQDARVTRIVQAHGSIMLGNLSQQQVSYRLGNPRQGQSHAWPTAATSGLVRVLGRAPHLRHAVALRTGLCRAFASGKVQVGPGARATTRPRLRTHRRWAFLAATYLAPREARGDRPRVIGVGWGRDTSRPWPTTSSGLVEPQNLTFCVADGLRQPIASRTHPWRRLHPPRLPDRRACRCCCPRPSSRQRGAALRPPIPRAAAVRDDAHRWPQTRTHCAE